MCVVASHAAYQKAAVELDELLVEALGDFGGTIGGQREGFLPFGSPATEGQRNTQSHTDSLSEINIEEAPAAASRQERYRSLLAFHRWYV